MDSKSDLMAFAAIMFVVGLSVALVVVEVSGRCVHAQGLTDEAWAESNRASARAWASHESADASRSQFYSTNTQGDRLYYGSGETEVQLSNGERLNLTTSEITADVGGGYSVNLSDSESFYTFDDGTVFSLDDGSLDYPLE